MSCVSIPQVLALVFIRKLMDCIFTKRELSWLDDLMPESKKKKLEDAEEVLLFSAKNDHSIHANLNEFNQYSHAFQLCFFQPSGGGAEYSGRR